ncbi:MAG: hypothetical protein MUW56_13120 [Chryseobacterium sp.]|uniref:hypothetical protein n=1 Tax=Chryseobacterium sp. TaxID=1871047 RepID=UPI0025C687F6|nr:hypothetical protein [Chryseobacterium sp.]MCJ7934535.1 hypothetical protein [Chryseobacterium sp.]
MTKLIILTAILSLFLGCKKTSPVIPVSKNNVKDTIQHSPRCTLKEAENKILKLDEVIASSHFIDSLSNHKQGIALISDSTSIDKIPYYSIQAGYNSELRFENYYLFYVEKGNCDHIKILEPASGNIINIEDWRKAQNGNLSYDF